MWTRSELKQRGKEAFKRNYWPCVGAGLLISIASGIGAGISGNAGSSAGNSNGESLQDIANGANVSVQSLATAVLVIMAVCFIISTLVSIFLRNPVLVGGCKFFVDNASEPANVGKVGFGFKNGYGKVVVTLLLKDIFVMLWSLLFIVPGIIKAYEYSMVPYILADQPELDRKQAFELSKQMMKGQKWNAFVLDLSFFGWYLLSGITCGIVGLFYVLPYVYATDAELYLTLKKNV